MELSPVATTDQVQISTTKTVDSNMISPPATIGMVGGGQLGRMFAVAAATMGYRVVVFCQDKDEPAAQVADTCVTGRLEDFDAVTRFAQQCDVITLEFENIPAATIAKCAEHAPTYPNANVLAIAQDRLIEKSTLRDARLPVTPFAEVTDAESLRRTGDELGWPLIVKTARSGYDGKGQYRIENSEAAEEVPWSSFDGWIAEKCIAFSGEVSVVVARTADGRTKCFPVFENDHRHHILDVTTVPAAISPELESRAREIAIAATETLGVVGLLCVEFFMCDGDVMINEVAPRPHNSGHLTIEACETSQFQQHVRAVCGLPLGSTELISGGAAMANLLGDAWQDDQAPQWHLALEIPGVQLHLYGKSTVKAGRKMGHFTATGETTETAKQRVLKAREVI